MWKSLTVATALGLVATGAMAQEVTVLVSPTYAPMEFRDPTTNELQGLDIDLQNALAKAAGLTVTWTIEDPRIATVTADGLVTGVAKGKTVLKATVGDQSVSCFVIVN